MWKTEINPRDTQKKNKGNVYTYTFVSQIKNDNQMNSGMKPEIKSGTAKI